MNRILILFLILLAFILIGAACEKSATVGEVVKETDEAAEEDPTSFEEVEVDEDAELIAAKVEKLEGLKVVGKIDLDAINEKTRPAKKEEKEEVVEEKEEKKEEVKTEEEKVEAEPEAVKADESSAEGNLKASEKPA